MLSRYCAASTSLETILRSASLKPLTLKGIDTNLNLATWAAMSSLMLSLSRHLSAVLGGGAARRPACAIMVPEAAARRSTRSLFMGKILQDRRDRRDRAESPSWP